MSAHFTASCGVLASKVTLITVGILAISSYAHFHILSICKMISCVLFTSFLHSKLAQCSSPIAYTRICLFHWHCYKYSASYYNVRKRSCARSPLVLDYRLQANSFAIHTRALFPTPPEPRTTSLYSRIL